MWHWHFKGTITNAKKRKKNVKEKKKSSGKVKEKI
jgi:hypothetical protein